MKGLALAIGLICAAPALAQTTFSFSGLAWGESPAQVESKLKSAGMTLDALTEKLVCKIRSSCDFSFHSSSSSEVRGSAYFVDGGLSEITIYPGGDPAQAQERLVQLKQRYGQPSSVIKGRDPMFDREVLQWRAPSGETLRFDGGLLVYRSAAASAASAATIERNRVRY